MTKYTADSGEDLGDLIGQWFEDQSPGRITNIYLERIGSTTCGDALSIYVDHTRRQRYLLIPVDTAWDREFDASPVYSAGWPYRPQHQ